MPNLEARIIGFERIKNRSPMQFGQAKVQEVGSFFTPFPTQDT
jgi:hypothetical protein